VKQLLSLRGKEIPGEDAKVLQVLLALFHGLLEGIEGFFLLGQGE